MSALLVLTLVTTISFNVALAPVLAEGEENAEAPAAEAPETAAPAEGAGTEQAGEAAAAEAGTGEAAAQGTDEAAAEEENPGVPLEELVAAEKEEEGDDPEVSTDPLDTGLRRQTKAPKISSSSAIVMSGSTSEVVYEKHSERKMSPGKITLLMTAMVVIDNMYNDDELNNTVDITEKLASYGTTFKQGETVSVDDLMKAMLVGGSGQAAEALSRYSASSRKIFINEMNSKAMELGLMDTQFTTPRGSYSTKAYSTAHDLAIIVQAAMRYEIIKNDFALKTVKITATSADGDREIEMTNTNPLQTSTKQSELYNLSRAGILGELGDPVNAAQYAGAATVDDMQLIVILMDSKKSKVADEAKSLLQYADTKVTRNVIVKGGKKVGTALVRYGDATHVSVYTETKGFAYVPPEGSSDLVQTKIVIYDDLTAPLKEGSKVGEYRIYVADELKGTVNLVTKRNVVLGWWPSKYYISNLMTIGIGAVLFLILIIILRIIHVRRRRERRRQERRERMIREMAEQQLALEEDRRKRNWTDRTGSGTQFGLRIGDLREEARLDAKREEIIAEAARTGTSPKTIMKREAKEKAKQQKNTNTDVHN